MCILVAINKIWPHSSIGLKRKKSGWNLLLLPELPAEIKINFINPKGNESGRQLTVEKKRQRDKADETAASEK